MTLHVTRPVLQGPVVLEVLGTVAQACSHTGTGLLLTPMSQGPLSSCSSFPGACAAGDRPEELSTYLWDGDLGEGLW